MTSITQEVCKEAGVKPRDAERSKNFFALGLISWLYTRPVEPTVEWITERFAAKPQVADANTRAFRAGYDFGETAELFESNYEVRPATFEKGEYVQVTGNQALAWGLITASRLAGVPLFLGSYPITPGLGHPARAQPAQGVRGPHLPGRGRDRRHRRRPGRVLRRRARRDHDQRPRPRPQVRDDRPGHQPRAAARHRRRPAGRALDRACRPRPSRPTCCTPCTAATVRRRCRSWRPRRPSDCFAVAIEAVRLAVKYRTPVIVLSDGYLANGAEPWRLPDLDSFETIDPGFATEPNHVDDDGNAVVLALRARPRDAGPPVGAAGPARARAPHRRPREGRRQRQRLLRGRQPRADGPPASRQDRRDRRRHPAGRGERRDRGRPAAPRQLGLHLRRRGRGRQAGPGPRHEGGPRPPAPPATRCRPTWARCCTATPRCWCPRSTSAS